MSWLDERDDWEGDYGSIIRPFPLGLRLTFDYTSKTGKQSTRTVQVREYGETGFGVMLIGFCESRQAQRTFMASRIANCRDADAGQEIGSISNYLDSHYRKSVDFTLDTIFNLYLEALKIFVYFFRADGKIMAPERQLLLVFCKVVVPDERLDDEQIRKLVDFTPLLSNHGFKVEVGRLAEKNVLLLSEVLRICRDSIASKKSPSGSELDAVEYIAKRIKKAPPQAY